SARQIYVRVKMIQFSLYLLRLSMEDEDDLEFQLALFHDIRLSEIEAEQQKLRQKEKAGKLFSYQLLDCFHSTLIEKCKNCLDSEICKHFYPEELIVFWKLRIVCNLWKCLIDEWIKSRKIVLMFYQPDIFSKWKNFDNMISIREINWEILKRGSSHGFLYSVAESGNEIMLIQSRKWWNFLTYCE